MKSSSYTLGKGKSGCLVISIQELHSPTRRGTLIPFSVGSTRNGLLTSPASQMLNRSGSKSPLTTRMGNTLSAPRMGRLNSTRMKWLYHALTPINPRTYISYKQSMKIWKDSPRKILLQPNSLENPREWVYIHLIESSNPQ